MKPTQCNLPAMTLSILVWPSMAGMCDWTHPDVTKSLPRGWRNGVKKLHGLLGCDAVPARPAETVVPVGPLVKEVQVRVNRSEDYLKGLEHPAFYFRVELTKGDGEKAGADINKRSDYLEIESIHPGGALSRWNSANASLAVQALDRIVAVNGVQYNGTLMADELRKSSLASLRVLRVSKEDRSAMEQKKKDREVKKVLRERGPPGLGGGIPEPPNSKVAVLHAYNLDKFLAVQPATLLMFYANWCGHCQQMAPDYTTAADLIAQMKLPKSVKLAKFDDGDEANRVYGAGAPHKFNFTSYPSLFMYQNGKKEPFYGDHGAHEMAAHVAALVKGLDPEKEVRKSLLKTRPMLYRPDTNPDVVLDLEPEMFDDMVLKQYESNNRVWIIEYYSDKCPFCKSLKPEIIKAAEKVTQDLKGKVRFAGVNSRAFNLLAKRFGVTSYPWIISMYAGRKLEDMAGLGGADSVINWAHEQHKNVWKKKPKWAKELPKWPSEDDEDDTATSSGGAEKTALATPSDSNSNATGSWRELLGRRTWFFLHTLAAKYPEEPTKADGVAVQNLVASMGQHYPCPLCRRHLQAKLVDPSLGPVPTKSRTDLAIWFCKLHNMVNDDLGKKRHSCNAFELDLQYLKSCGECSASKTVDEDIHESTPWDYFQYRRQYIEVETSRSEL